MEGVVTMLKKITLGLVITMSYVSLYAPQTSPSPHNFRWALINTIENYCLSSQGLKKLRYTDPCLKSRDPLIDLNFIRHTLRKNDTLVKRTTFKKQCKRHQAVHAAHMSSQEIHDYCSDAYDHFKDAHNLYARSPRAHYVTHA